MITANGAASPLRRSGAGVAAADPRTKFPKYLALTEMASRLTDGPVGDEVYEAAAAQFSDEDLASLIWVIAVINAWNRLGATARAWPLTPIEP